MSNKILSKLDLGAASSNVNAYLDMAAELSVIGRKNHHQVTEKGVPLVYDLLVKIIAPTFANSHAPYVEGALYTVPNNWQTRNAVRMAHFLREEQREEAGVSKQSIGRYAKTLRLNMDSTMYGKAYDRAAVTTATVQRIYAYSDMDDISSAPSASDVFRGGVWDYSQLAQFTEDPTSGVTTGDPFYLNVCGGHSAVAPGPYTYVGVLKAYNQRRQTTLEDSTLTPGGDTQFIDSDSPFFRIPIQDVGEDTYVGITLDEQDNPPYSRAVDNSAGGDTNDSMIAQPQEWFQLEQNNGEVTMRVQAPLGLVQLFFDNTTDNQDVLIEVECLGTYEM